MGERHFCRSLLRISMAQICQELGWHAIQSTPCDLMTDILQRYIQQLATISYRSAEHYGRTEPDLDDLGLTFQQMGISLYELENYIKDVEPIPFKQDIPRFPLPRKNDLQHPEPGSRDDRERLQYIPAYLPPIIGSDDFGVPIANRDGISSVPGTPMETDSPESRHLTPGVNHISPRGEKREVVASPQFSEQAMKRLRLDGDGTPQELTAVTIGVSGELTPKRMGKLPIASTPPQRVIKPLSDLTPNRGKALTAGVLTGPKSPKAMTPGVQQKSPMLQVPGTLKQIGQPKSPLDEIVTPYVPTKYQIMKSKSMSMSSSLDMGDEFHFPPPKSPKSAALQKKQDKPVTQLTKKEKKALKVFEFDEDEFESKPKRDVESSLSDHLGSYKEPSPFVVHDDGKNDSGKDIKAKKLDKGKRKSISKEKVKVKGKLKGKKSKENLPMHHDKEGIKPKKDKKQKVLNKIYPSKRAPNMFFGEMPDSSDGDVKVVKKKIKKVKEKDKSKELKVKKLKQKSIEYKNKSKVKRGGVSPTTLKHADDSSPEKQQPIGKLSFIKSAGSGSKLKYKIALPSSERKNLEDGKVKTKKPLPKVKRLKASSSEVESSDKEAPSAKKNSAPTKDGLKDVVKKEKEDKTVSTPVIPKITFRLGGKTVGGDSPNVTIKTPSPPPSSPPPSPPRTVPKLSISVSAKKNKESKPKIVSTPKSETKSKKEEKVKSEKKKVKSDLKIVKSETKKESKFNFDSDSDSKSTPKTKTKAEVKTKPEPKAKVSKKKESERDSESDREKKPRKETKKEKLAKEKEKEKMAKEKEKEKLAKEKEKEKLAKEKEKEKLAKEKEKEKLAKEKEKEKMAKEKEKEKLAKEKEKEKLAKEKEKEKLKAKEDVKPKAEISPFDFDAPSPPPTTRPKREPSTPSRQEPPPGIFAPSEPTSPPPSTKSIPTRSSPARASSTRSPAPSRAPASQKSKQKASAPPPTPPPTKGALKALPTSATKGTKGAKKEKQKPLSPPPVKTEPPKPKEPEGPCSLISETVGIVINEHGEKIWYCPGCRQPDDGIKPMVGCDSCDDWYHWECVGLTTEPDSDEWFCMKCTKTPKTKRKRGRPPKS